MLFFIKDLLPILVNLFFREKERMRVRDGRKGKREIEQIVKLKS